MAVSVFEGNTADPKTLLPQVKKVRDQFGIERFVLVGDRGMLTQKQIHALKDIDGMEWIGALRPEAIRRLVHGGAIQLGLFDERNLFEIEHPDFPGERLVACRNEYLAKKRASKREELLSATARQLEKVKQMVLKGRLREKGAIGVRVGKVINKYKVGKHFKLEIQENAFDYRINQEKVKAEAFLDGIYIVRTSLKKEQITADETVRTYKQLSQAERAFRSMKTVDLMVRPIHHRLEDRVRAHIFLCMLAYYVQWHMMEAWRPLIYADEEQEAKAFRDPVAPARRSESAMSKIQGKRLEDGSRVYSFRGLLHHLGSVVRATCRCLTDKDQEATFTMITKYDSTQQKAMDLIETIHP